MGIETFPEIENFQKLPRRVIVKGGTSTFEERDGARLSGLVINNIGHPIRDLRVHVVIFDENKIPQINLSTVPDPDGLPQGGIGAFSFHVQDHPAPIHDYYLYANWRFDDRQ